MQFTNRAAVAASVLAVSPVALGQSPAVDVRPALPAEVMARVSAASCRADVGRLVGFGTRHTLSDAQSAERGIGAARKWLAAEMERVDGGRGRLAVSLESFEVPPGPRLPEGAKLVNVVGVIRGTVTPERRYYVVGHYDSRNGDGMDVTGDSPGANDDASGTVVVLQLARALADVPLESTVVFLCTAGEEQGLYGAKYHADSSRGRGEQILGVLNNDIVGDPLGDLQREPYVDTTSPVTDDLGLRHLLDRLGASPASEGTRSIRVFSEGLPRNLAGEAYAQVRNLAGESDGPSRQLARFIADVAGREGTFIQPRMVFRPDRFLRGGDHSAFNDAGFAAVRFTVPREAFDRQHQDVVKKAMPDGTTVEYGDTVAFVNYDYLADVARLNGAVLVHLANGPSVPGRARVVTAKLMNDTTLRWDKSPERDVAGYEVVWRETTAPDWEHSKAVGDVTEVTMPVSKDDHFFGVRAVDTQGYRSPVGFAAAGPQ